MEEEHCNNKETNTKRKLFREKAIRSFHFRTKDEAAGLPTYWFAPTSDCAVTSDDDDFVNDSRDVIYSLVGCRPATRPSPLFLLSAQ